MTEPLLTPQPEDNLRRLALLAEDSRRLFTLRQPITALLTVALTRDVDEIMARDPANEPEEAISAAQGIAEAMVRKALRGDATAFREIAERIEGKVGVRQGERDEEADRHRTTVQATIEGVVEAMTRRRTEQATPQIEDTRILEQRQDTPHVVVEAVSAAPDDDAQQSDR